MDRVSLAEPPVEPPSSSVFDTPSPPLSQKTTKRARTEPSNLVIACKQCRLRKVRCDSARPQCKNCTRRCDPCEYDVVPKRRGPDKQPGARHRMYKKKPLEGHVPSADQPTKRKKKTPQPPEPSAERHASSNNTVARRCDTSTPESGQNETSIELVPESFPNVSPSALFQQDQSASLGFTHEEIDNADLDATFRAAGFSSLDRFLRTHEQEDLAFPPLGLGFSTVASIDDIPQPWAHNIPSSIYHAAQTYSGYYTYSSTAYIPRGPSASFYRQTWWDSLLPLYSNDTSQSVIRIYQDLHFLLNNAIYWFSFINLPYFMDSLFDPSRRISMQPSLVLSALAFATLMKSSETGLGAEGRRFAAWLRDAAQSSLEASLNVSWIEPSLAQAAFLLVLFEASGHSGHTTARTVSAIHQLDSLIQALNLSRVDEHEPDANFFVLDELPIVSASPNALHISNPTLRTHKPDLESLHVASGLTLDQQQCTCNLTAEDSRLKGHYGDISFRGIDRDTHQFWLQGGRNTSAYGSMMARRNDAVGPNMGEIDWNKLQTTIDWPDPRNVGEMQKEESRRLCWGSMVLISALREYGPHFGEHIPDFFITRQENFALYFPGEAIYKNKAKESIWALHCRSALLWNACQRLRSTPIWAHRRVELVGKAWMEATAIENALSRHRCPIGEGVLFAGRDYLFQLKLLISNGFTRLIPLPHTFAFDRDSAKEWLNHRDVVATHIRKLTQFVLKFGANAISLALAKRPLSVWWAMYQIKTGTLIWRSDPSMDLALRQSLDFLAITDFLTAMWPSEHQTMLYGRIRNDLLHACSLAGISVPAPIPIPDLPPHLTGTMIPSPFFVNKPSSADILMAPLD